MKYTLAAAALALSTTLAQANEFEPAMMSYLETEIMGWADNQVLVDAILAQNAAHSGLTQTDIDALDQAWRSEVGTSSTPTLTPVLDNAAADFLRSQVEASAGAMTEVFIMDQHGLNVAASVATSDMWQGDEAKFSETYGAGAGAVHFGEVEFDESSQRYQSQISIAITDPATGDLIGAMTIGVDAESLM